MESEQPLTELPSQQEKVLVLDFGAQYVQLIVRRIREQRVYAEMTPYDTPLDRILDERPLAVVLSGGPSSVYEGGAPTVDPGLFEAGYATATN